MLLEEFDASFWDDMPVRPRVITGGFLRGKESSWSIGQGIKKRWQADLSLQNKVAAQHDPDESQIDYGADDLVDVPCGGARSRIGSFNQFHQAVSSISACRVQPAMSMSGNYKFS